MQLVVLFLLSSILERREYLFPDMLLAWKFSSDIVIYLIKDLESFLHAHNREKVLVSGIRTAQFRFTDFLKADGRWCEAIPKDFYQPWKASDRMQLLL